MKKRSIKFEVNFTNKWFYTFIFVGVILLLAIGVFAYNSGKAPSVMGHSGEEIMVSVNGQEVTLNDALNSVSSENEEVVFLFDNPISLYSKTGSGSPSLTGTIVAGTTNSIPLGAKEVLLYGTLDATGEPSAYFEFKFPLHSNWKRLVSSPGDAHYPNTNSVWVPLDSEGKLNWRLTGVAIDYSKVKEFLLEIQGYRT